jgi:osmoprotectant transport system permease protein
MTFVDDTLTWLTNPANWTGPTGIPNRLFEHMALSGVSLAIAIAIALPVGMYIGHTGRGATLAINSANLWRALPSLAVIAIVLPITAALDPQLGFKVYPTAVAMIVLAVPPMLVNTFTGLHEVDRDLVEAGRGQGFSEMQLLRKVELPLAVPVIVTGVRSATVQVVATATLGAIFGFGGLGRYLVDGLARFDTGMLFGGALLVAALVVVADMGFAGLQHTLTPRSLRVKKSASPASAASSSA